jgi:NitT/TauT family transport system substrate-binding protein
MAMKPQRLGILALAMCLGLAASYARAAETVKFLLPTVTELPSFAPWVLAKSEGYYAAEGLDVQFLVGRGGVDVATQVGAGNADMGEATGDTTIFVRGNGVPVKTVAVLGGGGLMQLVVRNDSGIKDLKGLRGKQVAAIAYADSTYYIFQGMLATVGLTKNDVKAQAVGIAAVMQLVSNNTMPAGICNPECATTIQDNVPGVKVYLSSDYTPSMAQAMVASDKMIAQRPEVIRKVERATYRAWSEIRKDPVKMAQVYVAAVPSHHGQEGYLGRVFQNYEKWVYSGKQTKTWAMDPERLSKLEDLYLSQGVIPKKIPVDQLYTNGFLPQ